MFFLSCVVSLNARNRIGGLPMSVCLISTLVISDEISMGRSFRGGLCENSHRSGLDRPAISPHPAHAGIHCRREPFQSALPPHVHGPRSSCVGGLSFHALTVRPSAAGRIPMRVDGGLSSMRRAIRFICHLIRLRSVSLALWVSQYEAFKPQH